MDPVVCSSAAGVLGFLIKSIHTPKGLGTFVWEADERLSHNERLSCESGTNSSYLSVFVWLVASCRTLGSFSLSCSLFSLNRFVLPKHTCCYKEFDLSTAGDDPSNVATWTNKRQISKTNDPTSAPNKVPDSVLQLSSSWFDHTATESLNIIFKNVFRSDSHGKSVGFRRFLTVII